jgi:hypothetical protein
MVLFRQNLSALVWAMVFVMFIPSWGFSKANAGFNAFAGAGSNFSFPGTLRAGSGDWEGGLLSSGFLGGNKVFSLSPKTYSSFALGINVDGFSTGLGFQAGLGFHQVLFRSIGLRGEVMARTNTNGAALAHGLLGLSYGF